MLPNLDADTLRDYRKTIRGSHSVTPAASVLSLGGKPLYSIRQHILDGKINIDSEADVVRSATLVVVDPDRDLAFDTDSPSDGALYADRMVRVSVDVLGPLLDEPIRVPLITGPIVKMSRDDALVTLEIQDPSRFGMGQAWRGRTYKKGTRKTAIIRDILTDYLGQSRMSIPQSTKRISRPLTIAPDDQPWLVAKKVAASMNRQLFFDGRGVAILRRWPDNRAWTFAADRPGATILTPPRVEPDFSTIRNAVAVKGAKPKGAKKAIQVRLTAGSRHPLNPKRLAPNGAGLYLVERIDDDSIRTRDDARDLARRILRDRLREATPALFDAVPAYHLDPGDLIGVETDTFETEARIRKTTIPITGAAQSIGYFKKTAPRRGRIR